MTDVPSPGQPTPEEPLASPPQETGSPAASVTMPSLETSPPKRRFPRKLGLVVAAVVVVAAGAGLYVAFQKSKNNTSAANTKKDIPLLTYGDTNKGTFQYPINELNSSIAVQMDAQLFEGLVQYRQQSKLAPLLATSWSNPDTSTWIFNLRQGVKFHSGRTMTAQDVKYTLDYAVAHQGDDDGSSILSLASTIKQVDITGPYQIKITTTGPDPVLLNRLSFLGIVDSKAKLGDYDAGTGPYVIKPGTTPNTSSIDLVASSNYWGGHIYTREVDVTLEDNASQLAADTAQGKFDLAGDFNASQLSKIKNYQAVDVPDQGITFLGLNTEKAGSPLQSLAARQAAAYALNIPAILKAAGEVGQQANQLVPALLPGHDPSIANTPYDPAKAKQLLATVPNASSPLTLSYLSPLRDTEVNEIAKELNAVGFNVKTAPVSDINALANTAFSGQTDMYYLTYTSNTLDGLDILNTLLVGNQVYDNPQIDSLVNQASGTLDPATRITQLQKIAQIVNTEKPNLPLFNITRVFALTKPYVVSVDIPSSESGIYFWQVYQK